MASVPTLYVNAEDGMRLRSFGESRCRCTGIAPGPASHQLLEDSCRQVAALFQRLDTTHFQTVASRKRASTLLSRYSATRSASAFPYVARKLAILSHDRCTPSGRSSTRTVTGAYEPASGTCFAISIIMSGFPMIKRMILGVSRHVSLRTTVSVIQ